MLIIVEDGYPKVLQSVFDIKATRGGDVFKVDAADARGKITYCLHYFVAVLCCQADREGVYIGQSLEED